MVSTKNHSIRLADIYGELPSPIAIKLVQAFRSIGMDHR